MRNAVEFAALRARLHREAVEHALYENQRVHTPLRVAVELVTLRRFVAACRRSRLDLPPRLRAMLDGVPHQDEKSAWDALGQTINAPDPAFATRRHE